MVEEVKEEPSYSSPFTLLVTVSSMVGCLILVALTTLLVINGAGSLFTGPAVVVILSVTEQDQKVLTGRDKNVTIR